MIDAVMDAREAIIDNTLYLLMAVFGAAIVASLYRLHRDPHYRFFNLIDLVTNKEGRISRPAVMEFGVFVAGIWGFFVYINKGTLPEWYWISMVGAFVLRAAHSAHLSSHWHKNPSDADTHQHPPEAPPDKPNDISRRNIP